jgi:hypothetical protein
MSKTWNLKPAMLSRAAPFGAQDGVRGANSMGLHPWLPRATPIGVPNRTAHSAAQDRPYALRLTPYASRLKP